VAGKAGVPHRLFREFAVIESSERRSAGSFESAFEEK